LRPVAVGRRERHEGAETRADRLVAVTAGREVPHVTASAALPQAASPRPGVAAQAGYGVGQIAGQVFRDLPSLLLLFFLTTVLGIEPAIAGTVIFIPKLILGVGCDVAVGILSDRWKRRIARRWWLLAGAAGSPVAMLLLFHVPSAPHGIQIAYVAFVFSLYMVVFSSFSVPYLAIASQLASTPEARTVVMAWRLTFTAAGVLASGALAPWLVQHYGGGQPGYEAMSMALAIICPTALVISFFGAGAASRAAGHAFAAASPVVFSLRDTVAALRAPRFSVLLGVTLLQLTGAGLSYASMLYFLSYNMARPDAFTLIGVLVLMACAGIVVAQPVWVALARRFGKKRVWLAATLLYAVLNLVWAFAAHAGSTAAYALSGVAGLGNSGWALLGFSMLSDIAGDDEERAGLYSAVWIAADKIGFALGGTLLTGLVLQAFGFDVAAAVRGLPQPASALTGIMLAFGVLPALFNIVAAGAFARWGRTV